MHLTSRFVLPRALFALALFATIARAQVPTWAKTTPADVIAAGIGVQMIGADYGNSTFVLTAYFTTGPITAQVNTPAAYTSPDGVTWTRRTLPGVNSVPYAPRFLNGKFFIAIQPSAAGNGVIASSADGISWTTTTLGASVNAPSDLSFGNGLYVGCISSPVPGANQIITSTDGATWTPRSITANANGNHIAFFNGKFYATVSNFSIANGSGLYSSADGIAWTKVTGAPANPGYVAATTNTLLVTFQGSSVGQSISTDGTTFATAAPGLTLPYDVEIRAVNGALTATVPANSSSFDFNLARASLDGRTWTTIGTTANQSSANELAYGNGRYVFVGEFDIFSGTTTITPGGSSTGGGSTGGGATAPAVTTQPTAQSTAAGGRVTFTAAASGTGLSYQWLFNGTAITGATNATYTIASVTTANAGNYSVAITNSGGTTTSNAAALTVAAAGSAGAYLANLSIRAFAGSGSQTLIVGLTVGGAGTSGAKNVLVRGIGPALAGFGLASAITDPKLTAFAGSTAIGGNDNWVPSEVATTASAVGAFPLTTGSKDAAFLGSGVTAGSYSIILEGVNNTSGIALAELYDATPAANFTAATPRFTNVSSRTFVGAGDQTLICGFVVGGTGTRRILIRAVGPGLAQFGLTGLLADPQLALYNGSNTQIASNDNWDSATTLTAQQSVGAFALPANSKDSVLVATVTPGAYTVTITGVGGGTGTALIELYELP